MGPSPVQWHGPSYDKSNVSENGAGQWFRSWADELSQRRKENSDLKVQLEVLSEEMEGLRLENARLRAGNSDLKLKIKELTRKEN